MSGIRLIRIESSTLLSQFLWNQPDNLKRIAQLLVNQILNPLLVNPNSTTLKEGAIISMYAMQRANGDWFALDDSGRLRVPIFRSTSEAMEARTRNPGMLLFKPVILDDGALNDLAPTETDSTSGFWLISNPSINLRHGHPVEYAHLVSLISETVEQSHV